MDPCEWRVSTWGSCSQPCGGGVRHRFVTCPRPQHCDHPKPVIGIDEESCNNHDCQWTVTSWGPAHSPVEEEGFAIGKSNAHVPTTAMKASLSKKRPVESISVHGRLRIGVNALRLVGRRLAAVRSLARAQTCATPTGH